MLPTRLNLCSPWSGSATSRLSAFSPVHIVPYPMDYNAGLQKAVLRGFSFSASLLASRSNNQTCHSISLGKASKLLNRFPIP